MDNRQIRALAMISKGDTPLAVSKEEFLIPSQSDNSKKYKVWHKQKWSCNCPDFEKRGTPCKHILATQFWIRMRDKANNDSTLDIEAEVNKSSCHYCGSENIVKNGTRKTANLVKNRFLCRDCNRTFIENKDFEKFKGDPKLITLVMDLYFKGISFRKIKDHVHQFYGKDIHHDTIRRWVVHFSKKLNDHVSQLQPKLSDTWHADEQFVLSRTNDTGARSRFAYCWNVLDAETRFLIASKLTQFRGLEEANAVMKEAKENAGSEPSKIITDKLHAYPDAIANNFLATKHYRYKGFKDNPQNNMIERFHSTFRERDKVMRGLNSVETAQQYVEAFRNYYNFIRPHSVLGMTPAQAAGIDLDLTGNRWLCLLKK